MPISEGFFIDINEVNLGLSGLKAFKLFQFPPTELDKEMAENHNIVLVPRVQDSWVGKKFSALETTVLAQNDKITALETTVVAQDNMTAIHNNTIDGLSRRIYSIDVIEGCKLWAQMKVRTADIPFLQRLSRVQKKEAANSLLMNCSNLNSHRSIINPSLKAWIDKNRLSSNMLRFFLNHRGSRNSHAHFDIPQNKEEWAASINMITLAFNKYNDQYPELNFILEELLHFNN